MNSTSAPASPLAILTYPHASLRDKALAVTGGWDEALAFATRMEQAMRAAEGIGLAATQVGDNRRIIVVEVTGGERPAMLLANPVVTNASGETNTHEEGCLSIPGPVAPVKRPAAVTVKARDLVAGAAIEIEADGLLATCLQHEIDHLDGVLFIDHLSRLRRDRVLALYRKGLQQANAA